MSDLIDRQAAIDVMLAALDDDWESDYAKDRMCELPSAQRTGRWIEDSGNIACSECHIIWLHRRTAFCPNCGAKMEEQE